MKRVLITGGCGFVGRHFANRLLDLGCHVTIVDNLVSGLEPLQWAFPPTDVRNMVFAGGDFREWCKGPFRAGHYDLIIHCAAVVGGRLKIDGDPLAVATDLAIDADFFNWCVADRECLPERVIYFSSSAVYPVAFQREDHWVKLSESFVKTDSNKLGMPDATYGWAKLTGEILARYAYRNYGLNVAVYRPFSGYGEDQALDYPFPSIIQRVLDREDPLVVWGAGTQLRDFIHIDDVVEGVLSTCEQLNAEQPMNLGWGRGVSFNELAALAAQIAGYEPRILNDSSKPQGVAARVCDTYNMKLRYQPQVTLDQGIERALGFQKDRLTAGT